MAGLDFARHFNDSTDRIICSAGACNITGAYTQAALIDRAGNTTNDPVFWYHDSGATQIRGVYIDTTQKIALQQPAGTVTTTTTTFAAADGWAVIVVRKAAGTSAIVFNRYLFSGGGWSTNESVGSLGDATSAAGGTMRISDFNNGSQFFNGDIAAGAVWSRSLSDVEVQTLHTGFAAWMTLTPAGAWLLNQASTATTVTDQTGNGANQTSITGTSVTTVAGAIAWDPALSTTYTPPVTAVASVWR